MPDVSDNTIFQEVDEEVRRERMKQLWDRYGTLVLAVAVLIVVGVGGWRGWQYYERQQAAEAGAQFEAAVTLADAGKHAEAEAAFSKLAAASTSGYRLLAKLRAANETARHDPAAAVKLYDTVAADPAVGREFQDLANIRAGLILVDTAPFADLKVRLEPLTAADRAYRHTAREILALAAWKAGDAEAARRWFDMIMTDAETPAGTRQRVEVLMALAESKS